MENLHLSDQQLDKLLQQDDVFGELGFELLDDDEIDPILHTSKVVSSPLPSIKYGNIFDNLRAFKNAVIDQAIAERWESRVAKSQTDYMRFTCFFDNYQWRARCNWNQKFEEAKVIVWEGEHTCFDQIRTQRPLVARTAYLLELIPKLMTIDRKTSITAIRDQILRYTGVLVLDRTLWRVKALLTEDDKRQQIDDFSKLPIYLQRLYDANRHPGMEAGHGEGDTLTTELLLSESDVFRRIFIGPYTSEAQYINSLPFVALDGTYLRNCFKQTLLLAVGRNGNNESWIIAWAVVESENDSSWAWFLERLVRTVPSLANTLTYGDTPPCVISDRNSSLLKAIESHLPEVTDVYCCWHLLKNVLNVTKHANKKVIKEAWWRFVFVKTEVQWTRAVAKMREVGGHEVVAYIEALDKSKFCVWKLPGPRYGHNSSGIVKGQNGHIRELREMGIMELLNNLWTRSSRKRQLYWEASQKWMDARDRYTPFARNKIMANTLWSRRGAQYATITAHNGKDLVLEAQIRCQYDEVGERIYTVRCQDFTCSCGQFQEWRLSCSHAITAIRFAQRNIWE